MIDELRKRPSTVDELADGLSVSKDILMQSFYYLSLNNEYLHIEGNRYLVLTGYPTLSTVDELADGLSVSKDILMQSFYYLSLNNEYLHIEGNRYLVLTGYPTLYIYKKI